MRCAHNFGIFLFFGLLASSAANAFEYPERPEPPGYVYLNDFAGDVAEEEEKLVLETLLKAFNNAQGKMFQMAVVTVDSTEGVPPEEYATGLMKKWNIGHKGERNGIVLLIAMKQKEVHLHVGTGLENVLPDPVRKEILRDSVKYFKDEKVSDGINNVLWSVVERIDPENFKKVKEAMEQQEIDERQQDDEKEDDDILYVLLLVLIVVCLLWMRDPGFGDGDMDGGVGTTISWD